MQQQSITCWFKSASKCVFYYIQVRLPVDTRRADDPHVKAHLLLQSHMLRLPPPISDYLTDTRGVLDNSIRLAQVGCLSTPHLL